MSKIFCPYGTLLSFSVSHMLLLFRASSGHDIRLSSNGICNNIGNTHYVLWLVPPMKIVDELDFWTDTQVYYGRTSVPTKRTWSENFVILWFRQSNILAISFSRWNVEHNEQAATDMKDHEVPKLTWSRGPHRLKPTRKPGAEPGSGLSQILISGQGRADKTMECMWLDISCSGSKKN